MAYAPHDLLWVSCPTRVWRAAKVLSSQEEKLLVEYEDEEEASLDLSGKHAPSLLRRNLTLLGDGALHYDNLTEVPELHGAAVLHALEVRFAHGEIYTLTGPVLLAVNPFRALPLYGEDVLRHYAKGAAKSPHVFRTAAKALEGLRQRYESQTVLISGESGAGKTETTKFVMQFLALAGARPGEKKRGLSTVEKQVLGSNPLLEAFGNAQTLRNDNSSRFGKYIELQFSRPASPEAPTRLAGARIHTYLLEKVRVIQQQKGEQSFHIFYQAITACEDPSIDLDLSAFRGESFKYLNQQEEAQPLDATLAAMDAVGLSKFEVSQIFAVLAAILHLGNVEFTAVSSGACRVTEGTEGAVYALLGCDLSEALTSRGLRTPEGLIRSTHSQEKALAARDALARHLYHAIFNYVVDRSNASIGFQEDLSFCGVLDIFGFEFFQLNSLEQLCINYTNELLQQYFNNFIFENETALYQAEGIPWDAADFPDNAGILELLHGKLEGVLPMLEEECFHVGGTSEAWCNKLVRLHEKHPHFAHERLKKGSFTIRHFAGPVSYQCQEFLEKNKDELSMDLVQCLKNSKEPFIRELVERLDRVFGVSAGGGRVLKAQRYSVSGEFRQQLKELLVQIQRTEPHFIRCIKPNPQNQAFRDFRDSQPFFDRPSVAEQLSYQGVLAAIKVARAGYPVRFTHAEFLREFRCLAPEQRDLEALMQASEEESRRGAQQLLAALEVKTGWALGATKIFLKQEPYESLRALRQKLRSAAATRLQSRQRQRSATQVYRGFCQALRRLQARWRGQKARQLLRHFRATKAATQLVAGLRSLAAMALRRRGAEAALKIQRCWRGQRARRSCQEQLALLRGLQRWWRSVKKRRRFGRLQESVALIQRTWRGAYARREVLELKAQRFRLILALRHLVRLCRRRRAQRLLRAKLMDAYKPKAPTLARPGKDEMVKEILFLRQLIKEQEQEILTYQEYNRTWQQQIDALRRSIFRRLRDCVRRI